MTGRPSPPKAIASWAAPIERPVADHAAPLALLQGFPAPRVE